MISINVGNNMVPEHSIIVSEDQTLRAALEEQGIVVSEETPFQLNGAKVPYASFDKTFGELHVQSGSFLLGVQNLKNA